MDYSQAILAVNAASIAILLFFTALLLATSRYHGARGWAALVTFVPTVPVYLYNFPLKIHNTSCFFVSERSSLCAGYTAT